MVTCSSRVKISNPSTATVRYACSHKASAGSVPSTIDDSELSPLHRTEQDQQYRSRPVFGRCVVRISAGLSWDPLGKSRDCTSIRPQWYLPNPFQFMLYSLPIQKQPSEDKTLHRNILHILWNNQPTNPPTYLLTQPHTTRPPTYLHNRTLPAHLPTYTPAHYPPTYLLTQPHTTRPPTYLHNRILPTHLPTCLCIPVTPSRIIGHPWNGLF
jgi:hypothetical protein